MTKNEYRYVWLAIPKENLPPEVDTLILENNFICQFNQGNPAIISQLATEYEKIEDDYCYLFRIKLNFGQTGNTNTHFILKVLDWKQVKYRLKFEPLEFINDSIDLIQYQSSKLVDDYGCFRKSRNDLDCQNDNPRDYGIITHLDNGFQYFSLIHEDAYHRS